MDAWFGLFRMQIQESPLYDFPRTQEQKNRKYGYDEEDEQNDTTFHGELISRRRICHKGIASLIRINLVFNQKPKKRLSSL